VRKEENIDFEKEYELAASCPCDDCIQIRKGIENCPHKNKRIEYLIGPKKHMYSCPDCKGVFVL
jgi:hypothetical protein